ncbi:MAG: outer membrane lipoprotein-sorting protein, partial [Gammaproteobacteria bacterium]|nr:outer membrane lipoprotein-sorting protein [Gammaproteobacteria bacterium]
MRETRTWWRDHRDRSDGLRAKRLIVFEAPPEVRETGFLVFSHDEPGGDDERWVYLPALRKVRRVAGRDRGKSFVGTDFSYD